MWVVLSLVMKEVVKFQKLQDDYGKTENNNNCINKVKL